MKAEELRIKNYVEKMECYIKINASDILNFSVGMNDIKPIPLTEEWLLKFGFTFSSVGVRKDNCDLIDIGNEFHMDGYGGNIQIKYVHQLQNLYFALTQTELTIK